MSATEPKTYTQEELDAELKKAKDGILAELTTERENRRKFEADLKAMREEFDKVKLTAEKNQSEKEKAELLAQGKYDEALKKHQEETQKIIESKDKAIAEMRSTVTKFRVDNQIMAAAGDAINPEQVTTLIKAGYEFIEKPDGTTEILTSGTKTPVLDKNTGKPLDIKSLTESFLAENKHLAKPGSTSGGAGTQSGSNRNYEPGADDFEGQMKKIREDQGLSDAEKRQEIIKIKARQMSDNVIGVGHSNAQETLSAVKKMAHQGG